MPRPNLSARRRQLDVSDSISSSTSTSSPSPSSPSPCLPIKEPNQNDHVVVAPQVPPPVKPLHHDPFGFNSVLNTRAVHLKQDPFFAARASKPSSRSATTENSLPAAVNILSESTTPITKLYGDQLPPSVIVGPDLASVGLSGRTPLQPLTDSQVRERVPVHGTKRRQPAPVHQSPTSTKASSSLCHDCHDENIDICHDWHDENIDICHDWHDENIDICHLSPDEPSRPISSSKPPKRSRARKSAAPSSNVPSSNAPSSNVSSSNAPVAARLRARPV